MEVVAKKQQQQNTWIGRKFPYEWATSPLFIHKIELIVKYIWIRYVEQRANSIQIRYFAFASHISDVE